MTRECTVKIVLFLIAGTLLAAGPTACVSTTTIERTTSQNALVPSPRGPTAAGPMLYDGEAALEVGYSYQPVIEDNQESRLAGANGELAVEHTLRARASFGLADRLELGVHLEGASASWAQARASDIGADDRLNSFLLKGGITARALVAGDRELGLGALVEVDLMGLSYVTEIHETAWVKFNLPPSGTFVTARERAITGTETYGVLRTGLFGVAEPNESVGLTFGMLVQNVPRFVGLQDEVFTCINASPSTCSDDINPADVPILESEVALTLFVSAGFTLGPMQLIVQAFAHPVMSDISAWETTPFGLDLGVRFVL